MVQKNYDIVVVGAGVAGGTIALCCAKQGLKTLVVENKEHPRFVIGESSIPQTTIGFRVLGTMFGVPELCVGTGYTELKHETDVPTWAKCMFWFGCHEKGKDMLPHHELMLETFSPPMGPDSHVLRSEYDRRLTTLFPKYGVDFYDNTSIPKWEIDDKTGIDFELEVNKDGTKTNHKVHANFSVDASGKAAFIIRKYGLLEAEPSLITKTRSLYGHFSYEDSWVGQLDRVMGGPNPEFRYYRDRGTGHHCFEGGWMWVIPFDNNTVSIGIVIDVDKYPYNNDVNKEDEFWQIVNQFPTVAKHFEGLKLVSPIIRTGRIQHKAKSIMGPRFIATPHCSGFVDALYSTGMSTTVLFINRFMQQIKKCKQTGNWDYRQFDEVEKVFFEELDLVDKVVSGSIYSMGNFEVYKQWWRIWVESGLRGLREMVEHQRFDLHLYGANRKEWVAFVDGLHKLLYTWKGDPLVLAQKLKDALDGELILAKVQPWVKECKVNTKVAYRVENPVRTRYDLWAPFKENNLKFRVLMFLVLLLHIIKYYISKLFGTQMSKWCDEVLKCRTPGNQNKFEANWHLILGKQVPLETQLKKEAMMKKKKM